MRSLYDRLRIAEPCTEDWESMAPSASGRSRHCDSCEREVHDISAMTRAEVVALFSQSDERRCGRYRTRADGAVIVADGHVVPPLDSKRRLPLVAALAFGLAACTTSAAPSPPDPAPSIAAPPSAVRAEPAEPSDAAPRDAGEEAGPNDAGTANDAAIRDAATDGAPSHSAQRKPTKPARQVEPAYMGGF